MEWRAGKDPNAHYVIVPDEFVVAIIKLLQGTGVAIDPYSDRTLGNESTQRILKVLKESRNLNQAEAEDKVRLELGVCALPAWADKIVAARMEQDRLMTICAALIKLCEHALSQDLDIEVMGQ